MKKNYTLLLLLLGLASSDLMAQIVNIPDANFKTYLVGNVTINTNGDTEIQVTEANAFSGAIDCSNQSISDLTGIEEFTSLTVLSCNNNQLTSLNLTLNTALTNLSCYGNQLTSLDVTQNTGLTNLGCTSNLLTSLDVTQNTALTILYCSSNQLTSLDVTQNTALNYMYCNENLLTSLDVSQNTVLITFGCTSNQLTSLDVTQNTALNYMYCDNNQLTSLDITQNTALIDLNCSNNSLTGLDVTQNTALTSLQCASNQLASLDVTQNAALTGLLCISNQLTSLDVSQNTALINLLAQNNDLWCLYLKNGNNYNMAGSSFNITNNPNLGCVEVDDVSFSTSNWTNIDAGTSFSLDCSSCAVSISENNISNNISIYPNPVSDVLFINSEGVAVEYISIISVTGKIVKKTQGNTTQVDVANLPKGLYLLEIKTINGIGNKRFVKL